MATSLRVVSELTPHLFIVEVTHEGRTAQVRMFRTEYLTHARLYSLVADIKAPKKPKLSPAGKVRARREWRQ